MLTEFGDTVFAAVEGEVTLTNVGLISESGLESGIALRAHPRLIVLLLTKEFVFVTGHTYF